MEKNLFAIHASGHAVVSHIYLSSLVCFLEFRMRLELLAMEFISCEGTRTSRGELISPDQQFKQKISPYIIGKCERGYKTTERSVATSSVNVESETNVAE